MGNIIPMSVGLDEYAYMDVCVLVFGFIYLDHSFEFRCLGL